MKGVATAIALLVGTAVSASAQAPVTGTATGCFYSGAGGSCTPAATGVLGTLSYTGSTFNDFVNSFGIVNFGGSPAVTEGGVVNINNFGSFALGSAPYVFGDPGSPTQFFTLMLHFTSPTNGETLFDASVTGEVTARPSGGVSVDFFNNDWQSVDGTIRARVNDVDVNPGQVAQLVSGAVTTTPEPASLVLLGTGLAGIFGAARRRRNKVAA